MSYKLGHHLSLKEIAVALTHVVKRERGREHQQLIEEILTRELRFFLVCVDSELSAITHGRPIDREECERLSCVCREVLGQG